MVLLQRLSEYADQIGLPPPMYQNVPVRYVIEINESGQYVNVSDCASSENKRGLLMLAPDCKRAYGIKPKLLSDNAEYTLGLARQGSDAGRVQAQHSAYVQLIQDCADVTHEPKVEAVAHFLNTLEISEIEDELNRWSDFDPGANMTFEVNGERLIHLDVVRHYWAKKSATGDFEQSVECLVCGEIRPPVKRLPILIKGIPGGQSSGMTLISANKAAFLSYGLEASLIAPTCEDCGQRFGNALNALLNNPKTHLVIPPVVYIFWTREPTESSISALLSPPNSDYVRQFLTTMRRGISSTSYFDPTPFYASALSASGARIVIRDWIETTLCNVQVQLKRYFELQKIDDGRSDDHALYFPLWRLVKATVREGGKEEPAAQVGQALLHLALHGGALPKWLLFQMVRRTRAEQDVQPIQAALIKMVLLSQEDIRWLGYDTSSDQVLNERERGDGMAELNLVCRDEAYLCGRLLAELEAIQRAAMGPEINATIVDRYYGTASSAPASVFGRLMRMAQPHMATLRRDKKGVFLRLDEGLQEILDGFEGKAFPPTLNLMEQGRFALGYYQQKAANRRAAPYRYKK